MITATLKCLETGETETENFASYDLLDELTSEIHTLIITEWEHWEGDTYLGGGRGGNAEPELRCYLESRGELELSE